YYLHRCPGTDLNAFPAIQAEEVLKIATLNGAGPCGFSGQVGALKVGMAADMILVDMEEILNAPWADADAFVPWLFVRRALGRHVNTVIIDGEVVMADRRITTLDVDALYQEVRQAAGRGRSPQQLANEDFLQRIKPYYQAWYNNWLQQLDLEPFYLFNSKY
ncbi:MAG: amidohydrolase family protein, partial [Oscillospiraceae bacterium]